jgi:hypothetical protein
VLTNERDVGASFKWRPYLSHLLQGLGSGSGLLGLSQQLAGLGLELFGALVHSFTALLLLLRSAGKLFLFVEGLALWCPFCGSRNIELSGFLGLGFGGALLTTEFGSKKSRVLSRLKLRLCFTLVTT